MDNWWLAASSRQRRPCSYITTHTESLLEKHQITQVTQPHYSPDLVFPKTKITFEKAEISGHRWDSVKYDRIADGDSNKKFCRMFLTMGEMLGELCEVPKCLLCTGLRYNCPMYNVSYILCFLQWMSLFFIVPGCILSGLICMSEMSGCIFIFDMQNYIGVHFRGET